MTELYTTRLLDPDGKLIRVLDVAAATDNEAAIEATLRTIHLTEPFTALSYVWGAHADPSHTITCNGTPVKVTKNCMKALWHLRRTGNLTIWIDAVCINQEDAEEKVRQIQLMSEIYASASTVYVWLGSGSANCKKAMEYFAQGGIGSKSTIAAAWSLLDPRLRAYPHDIMLREGKSWTGHVRWVDVLELLNCHWTQRMWTYQEILLASNPVIVYGKQHIPWKTFEDTLLLLTTMRHNNLRTTPTAWLGIGISRERLQSTTSLGERRAAMKKVLRARFYLFSIMSSPFIGVMAYVGWLVGKKIEDDSSGIGTILAVCSAVFIAPLILFMVAIFLGIADHHNNQYSMSSVADFVNGFYRRNATEPRDMAYGVWTVLRKLGAQLEEPSYDNDVDHTYWQLATTLLDVTKDLQILLLAAASRVDDAPSWVPDWSARERHKWNTSQEVAAVDLRGKLFRNEDLAIKARAAEKEHLPTMNEARTILTVTARELGTIGDCLHFHETSSVEEKELHLANLRASRAWMALANAISYSPRWMVKHMVVNSTERLITAREREIWEGILDSRKARELEALLQTAGHVPDWFNEFMPIQIKVCNLFAQRGRKLCQFRTHDHPNEYRLAVCNLRAMPGDQILRIHGLMQPLIVRRMALVPNGITLVSPITMDGYQRTLGTWRCAIKPMEQFEIY